MRTLLPRCGMRKPRMRSDAARENQAALCLKYGSLQLMLSAGTESPSRHSESCLIRRETSTGAGNLSLILL